MNDALLWEASQPPNEQWASRYQGSYKVVQNYIETSRVKARNNKYLKNAIIAIFIILPILGYSWYHQNDLKNINARNKIAEQYQDSLKYKNDTLNINLVTQKALQENLLISFNEQQLMAKNKAQSDLQAAILKAENEEKERKRVQEERNRVEIEGLKSRLKQEPFYNALYKENGNFENGDAVIDALVNTYNSDKSEYNKFYQAISQIYQAREIAQDDPVSALRLEKIAWQNSHHPIIDSNIQKQVANKIFYKQRITPFNKIEFQGPSLFISSDKKTFAINNALGKIYTGVIDNDSITMDEDFDHSYANSFSHADFKNNSYKPLKAFSIKGDSILELEGDGTLSGRINNKRIELGKIPYMHENKIIEFSPNQHYLVTAPARDNTNTKDTAVVLWDISGLKENTGLRKIIIDSNNTNVEQISFSPNSRQYFVQDSFSFNNPANLKIYSVGNIQAAVRSNIVAAQFTQNGYIVTINRSGEIDVCDSDGSVNKFTSARLDNKEATKYLNDLEFVSLSPDWKRIMFKQDGKISIFERDGGDSIIKTKAYQVPVRPLKLNSVYASQDKNLATTAAFIDNSSILSVNNNGTVLLWKIYSGFQNTEEALRNIQLPDLTIGEKLDNNSLTFDDIKSSQNEHDLRKAARYFEGKYYDSEEFGEKNSGAYFSNAMFLYKKLIGITDGEKKLYYLDKTTSLNRAIRNSISPDIADQKKLVASLQENVALLQNEAKNYPGNKALTKKLSYDYNDLSFRLLFIKQYGKSIEAARRGLAVDSTSKILYTNLALGYLLSKNFSEADKVYNLYKDSSYENGSFKNGFLRDFEDLEWAEIFTPEEKDVYEKMQEIKSMLENTAGYKNRDVRQQSILKK